jgi:hypothetical protein
VVLGYAMVFYFSSNKEYNIRVSHRFIGRGLTLQLEIIPRDCGAVMFILRVKNRLINQQFNINTEAHTFSFKVFNTAPYCRQLNAFSTSKGFLCYMDFKTGFTALAIWEN